MQRAGKAAFTLIELLVVIAIIAILAAILFPVFARARDKGRQAACMSNTKQIMLGAMQYNQDYDEYFVRPWTAGAVAWFQLLQPYVKNSQVFQCPSDPSRKAPPWVSDRGPGGRFHTSAFLTRMLCDSVFLCHTKGHESPPVCSSLD